ncbi:MAG TPA: ATP-binding protein [Gaiellaceae bacterium]
MRPPTPANERERLAALRRYDILDTPPEQTFDDLALLAAQVCGTPISLVTLVDEERQWFKARVGIELTASAREVSICAHAIAGEGLLEVPDAELDPRFLDNPYVTADGGFRFYAGAPLVTPEGAALGTLCVIDRRPRRLSDHQREALRALARQVVAQLELRRAAVQREQALAALTGVLAGAKEAYASFDEGGTIVEWNRAAEQLFGWSREEAVGRTVADTVMPVASRDVYERMLGELRAGRDPFGSRMELTALDRGRREFPVEATFWLHDTGGHRLVHVLAQDVSARRAASEERERLLRAEQEARSALAEQNERLRALDRMKDEFVSLVSHELRTPLSAIRGYMEPLLDEEVGPLAEEQRRFLAVVDRNAERLTLLVDDLLFVAQVDAGKLRLELEDVSLSELVRHAAESARYRAEQGRVTLELELDEVVVRGDRARLAQLVDNLLANGIKFTPPGGLVKLRVRRECEGSVIEVCDTGMGIPPEEREQLFDRFFRTAAATRNAIPGTGLGLAICKAIVEAHRGVIEVESVPGEGATFSVRLPAEPADPEGGSE